MPPTISQSDVLKAIPYGELASLAEVLKSGGSLSMYAYYFVLNLQNWHRKLESHEVYPLNEIEVFVPQVGIQNGTFVCFDKTGKFTENYVYFFTNQPDCSELLHCLRKTKLIDWKSCPLFGAVHSNHLDTLNLVLKEKDLPIASKELLYYFDVSLDDVCQYDDKVPDGLELRDLDEHFGPTLDEGWIFRNDRSLDAVAMNLRLNGAIGLFDKKQNRLLGWITMNEHMALGLLRVIDGEKRKGYAKILVKHYCKRFVKKEGLLPLTFVSSQNQASLNLFQHLKFNVIGESFWIATGSRSFSHEYECK